jgi:uncharacterized protein involved in type VI secretion and phage assembly
MREGLVETAAQVEAPSDRRVYGVALAQVINNVDLLGLGRVQVHLPWIPEIEPWARISVLMAGAQRGTYFIPQVGDEVLVAFNHGDIREPYVLGSLWNGRDRPPAGLPPGLPTDARNKRIIRTPLGHEVEFDDLAQSIRITSTRQQKITIEPNKIEISTTGSTATLTLNETGSVSIQANRSIDLKAPKITIEGTTVEMKGSASTRINGGQLCDVQAALVKIN